MIKSVLAISAGASAGAVLRWFASLALNRPHQLVPMGTLSVNLIGGYLIGFLLCFFMLKAEIAQEWHLLVIVGFLGSLTTFSTFSAEVVMLMQIGRFGGAFLVIALHVIGSLCLTFLGIMTCKWLFT